LVGLYGFIEKTVEARALADSSSTGWHNPFPLELGVGISFLWFVLTINLVLPAFALGLVVITRSGSRQVLRAIAYAALIVAGVAGQFWGNSLAAHEPGAGPVPSTAWDVLGDGRIGDGLMCLTAITVGIGSAVLLQLRRARRG
jgi:hypothetical protein